MAPAPWLRLSRSPSAHTARPTATAGSIVERGAAVLGPTRRRPQKKVIKPTRDPSTAMATMAPQQPAVVGGAGGCTSDSNAKTVPADMVTVVVAGSTGTRAVRRLLATM